MHMIRREIERLRDYHPALRQLWRQFHALIENSPRITQHEGNS